MLLSQIDSSSALTASWSQSNLAVNLFGGLPQDAAVLAMAVCSSRMLGMPDFSKSCSSSTMSSSCFLLRSALGFPAIFFFSLPGRACCT